MIRPLAILGILLAAGFGTAALAQQGALVGSIAGSTNDDLSCSYRVGKTQVLLSGSKEGRMTVGGKAVKLVLTSVSFPVRAPQVGDSIVTRFEGDDDLTVELVEIITRLGGPATSTATITVQKGKRKQVVRAKGTCP